MSKIIALFLSFLLSQAYSQAQTNGEKMASESGEMCRYAVCCHYKNNRTGFTNSQCTNWMYEGEAKSKALASCASASCAGDCSFQGCESRNRPCSLR